MQVLAQNRGVTHDYHILEKFEAGMVLRGSEVKSLRMGRASLSEAFIISKGTELFLHNAHINSYSFSSQDKSHQVRTDRKLLLHARQIRKLIGSVTRKGMTIVPLKIYTNEKGFLKLEIALATGMKKHDKRQALKEREWKRNEHRILKQKEQA